MKINKINIPPVNPYRTNQLKAEQAQEQAKIKTDKLEISSEAKQLSETSPITTQRNERVQQLKAQIESGDYKVDAEKLASNLIKYYKKITKTKAGVSMSIDTILSILDNLEKLHKSLLRIANEKTALIKSGDINGIDQLMKDEQAHLAAIVQMDNDREKAVIAYLKGQGRPVPMNPTIATLIEATPEPEKNQLVEAKDRLLHAIHELKWQNDLNQKLTYQSLQFVNLSLDMIRPRPESATYSKTEINGRKETKDLPNFDSQA